MQLLRQSNRTPVEINARFEIGSGGEAHIYALPDDESLVAKVYKRPTEERARKLAAMLADPPADPTAAQGHASIAWPVDLLSEKETGRVAGYLMPRAVGTRPIIDFYNPATRRAFCPLFNYQYLIRTARNLAAVLGALHARNYVIGDVNESNILVTPTSLVTVVDTDSFQVPDRQREGVFRCPVGKPEFTPAELQGKMLHYIDRTPEHDLFGLAVLIFQLLMEGTHPFAGVYLGDGDPPPYEARIAAGHFPYGTRPSPYRPQPLAPPISILPMQLWQLFTRCFQDGYDDPRARPDAQTWAQALRDAENNLLICPVNDQHRYGKHLHECPWCERKALLGGRDPFPSQAEVESRQHLQPGMPVQTPLPTAATPVRIVEPRGERSAEVIEPAAPEPYPTPTQPAVTAASSAASTLLIEPTTSEPPRSRPTSRRDQPPAPRVIVAAQPRRTERPAPRSRAGIAVAAAALVMIAVTTAGLLATHKPSNPPPTPAAPVSHALSGQPAPTLEMLEKAVSSSDSARVQDLLAQAPQLAKGANKSGWTPLHYAAYGGHTDIAQPLIAAGADVNAPNKDSFTPLHLAAQEGHPDVAQLLIQKGANVNARENLGWTPLHFAAQEGHTDIAKLLIAGGADVNSKENTGLTPLAVAVKENKQAVADLLRRHGGQQ